MKCSYSCDFGCTKWRRNRAWLRRCEFGFWVVLLLSFSSEPPTVMACATWKCRRSLPFLFTGNGKFPQRLIFKQSFAAKTFLMKKSHEKPASIRSSSTILLESLSQDQATAGQEVVANGPSAASSSQSQTVSKEKSYKILAWKRRANEKNTTDVTRNNEELSARDTNDTVNSGITHGNANITYNDEAVKPNLSKHEKTGPISKLRTLEDDSEPHASKQLADSGHQVLSEPPTSPFADDTANIHIKTEKTSVYHPKPKKQPIKDVPVTVVPPSSFNVVLTHATADFDSLASAVGLAKLWTSQDGHTPSPATNGTQKSFVSASHVPTFVVLPRGAHPGVQRFLALHKHLFPIRSLKSLPDDISGLNRLALVDAQRRDRLGPAEGLLEHAKRIVVVDHHVDQDSDIPATDYVVDRVGSVSTLVSEYLKAELIELSEAEAVSYFFFNPL